jgi:FixJ family two-component response regulator
MERRKNRSDHYQHFIAEISTSPDILTELSDQRSVLSNLNPYAYNETLLDLQDQLRAAYWRIIDTKLTPRQREVIHLCKEGLTQCEIAKALNVNQSSITKSIHGNCDYKNGKRVYGGAKKKLQKMASEDEEIKILLERIAELIDDEDI